MPGISIVTDTDSSLSAEIAASFNIRQVPIFIHFGEEIYETGMNINDRSLFERVDKEGKLPTTAAPTPGKFAEVFSQSFKEDGSESLICFCISSAMSATVEAARTTAREILPDKDITIVDTETLSMRQGYMVLAAAEAVRKGATAQEAVQAAVDVRKRSHLYGALATLKYLSMSGRVSHLASGMAGMLNIRPIPSVQNEKLDMLEKVRTKNKAWSRVVELTRADVEGTSIEKMAVVHVNAAEDAAEFTRLLHENLACPEKITLTELTPGLSVHTGAGLVAVAFVTAK